MDIELFRSFTEDVILCQQMEYRRRYVLVSSLIELKRGAKYEYIKSPLESNLIDVFKIDFSKVEAIDNLGYCHDDTYKHKYNDYHKDGICYYTSCGCGPNGSTGASIEGGAVTRHYRDLCFKENVLNFHIHKNGKCYQVAASTVDLYYPFFFEYKKKFQERLQKMLSYVSN